MTAKFSEDWKRFYDGVVLESKSGHILKDIEEQVAHYEAIWQKVEPFDCSGYDRLAPSREGDRLRIAALNVELIARVTLCRSVHLLNAFIEAVNRDDFQSVPLLLRATLEEGARGIHAARRMREALEKDRPEDAAPGDLAVV